MITSYQAIVAAPLFSVGVRCDEFEILGLDYLPPCPDMRGKSALAGEVVRQLRAYLSDASFCFGLPMCPTGTAFQRRVWAAIEEIPCRQTRTYGDLAKLLHNAPRAVGQACGANPFSLVVPCHRVVAAGGALGGFGGSRQGFLIDVKRWLLAHEGG